MPSDKYSAARKILSEAGRLSGHMRATVIYAKMDDLGYAWDADRKVWYIYKMTHSRPE